MKYREGQSIKEMKTERVMLLSTEKTSPLAHRAVHTTFYLGKKIEVRFRYSLNLHKRSSKSVAVIKNI